MKAFVSSYALCSPALVRDPDAEDALFDGLAELDLAGLELPFYGRFHEVDEERLIARLRPEWRFVVTLLPGTMNRLREERAFGLASADDGARRRAVDFAESARRAVARLDERLGRAAVAAVTLHSAPRTGDGGGARASLDAFARSLSDLRARDWSGAELLVEHCDAPAEGRVPDKGFLRVEDDCAALALSRGGTRARLLVNWGRSALETRSADGPLAHLSRARQADLLGGLFFSGVAAADPDYGAWKDSHAPFSTERPSSLLTPSAARAALAAAGPVDFLGVKIQPLPESLSKDERLTLVRGALSAVAPS